MKKLRIGWSLCLVVALAFLPMRAVTAQETGILRGTVLDSTSQQPVAGAQVQLVGTNRVVTTNTAGVYTLSGVPEGPATLRIQRIGYAQTTVPVTVGGGTIVTRDVTLRPVITTL